MLKNLEIEGQDQIGESENLSHEDEWEQRIEAAKQWVEKAEKALDSARDHSWTEWDERNLADAKENLGKVEQQIEIEKLVAGIRSGDMRNNIKLAVDEGNLAMLCEAGKQKLLTDDEKRELFSVVMSRHQPEEVAAVYLIQPEFSVSYVPARNMLVLGLGALLMENHIQMMMSGSRLSVRERIALEIITSEDEDGVAALAKNLEHYIFGGEEALEVGTYLIEHGYAREVANNFTSFSPSITGSIYEPDFLKNKYDIRLVKHMVDDGHRELILESIAKNSSDGFSRLVGEYLVEQGVISQEEVDEAVAKYKAEHLDEPEKRVDDEDTVSRRRRERLEAEASEEMPVTNPVMLEAFKENLERSQPPYMKTLELSDGKSFESHLILPAVYEKSDTLKTIGLWVPDYSRFSLADTNNPHEWVARNLKEFLSREPEAAKDFSSDFEPVQLCGSIYLIPGKLDDEEGFYVKVEERADEDESFVNRIMGFDLQRILKTLKAYGAFGVIVPDNLKIPEPLKESGFFVKLKDKSAISDSEKRMVDQLQTQEFFDAMRDNPDQDVLNVQKKAPDIVDRSQIKDGTGFYQHEGD